MTAELLSWGVEDGYVDARGTPRSIDLEVERKLWQALRRGADGSAPLRRVAVLRRGDHPAVRPCAAADPLCWSLRDGARQVAAGVGSEIVLPESLPLGSYQLSLDLADGTRRDNLVLVAPDMAYQPPLFNDGGRAWLLTVQLYGVRSARNWGHGDFSDLARLLEIAKGCGAAGLGVNPLHALAPGQASCYSPTSRLFLNPLYIDLEAIPEFPGAAACGLAETVARLRAADDVDYGAVYDVKRAALGAAYAAFRQDAAPDRCKEFESFCARRGARLQRFAVFETLAERFGRPWQSWPKQWHDVAQALARAQAGELGDVGLAAFIQWIADAQLRRCVELARALSLPVGLYLDVAVGVDAGGADVWAAPHVVRQELCAGAPPDVYNPNGQNWGLASFHPQALIDTDFLLFRQMLRSAMQYAGAIRIDHALGLNRLYLVPAGSSAADGGYVRFPFRAMLAVITQESVASGCLVIGEDLGTIPDGVRETLIDWGIWSYRVALFEREHSGAFREPEHFIDKALVTFTTHDLPSFAGWRSSHDRAVKTALGLDPGESEGERQAAREAMRAALAGQGLAGELHFLDVLRYLARARSQLLAVAVEDILGLLDQPNLPGTVDEHPNWRRRLPLDMEAFAAGHTLRGVAEVMAAEGRAAVHTDPAPS